MTFRVRTSAQLAIAKENKKAVRKTVQTYDITKENDSEDDDMGL
jgi:hypothetical protein